MIAEFQLIAAVIKNVYQGQPVNMDKNLWTIIAIILMNVLLGVALKINARNFMNVLNHVIQIAIVIPHNVAPEVIAVPVISVLKALNHF